MNQSENDILNTQLTDRIANLITEARKSVVATVNVTMVYTYYETGRVLVEDEQQGNQKAEYGKHVLELIAKELTKRFGKCFSYSNLRQMRQFYLCYSEFDKHCLSN